MKPEQRFGLEVRNSFRRIPGAFYFKIPDLPVFRGSRFRFGGRRPFDAFAVVGGKTLVMEYKVLRGRTLPFSVLAPHQERALREAERAGARAYVLVNYRGKGRNLCVAFPIRVWLRLRRRMGPSLPFGGWRGAREVPRVKGGTWAVEALLDGDH